MSVPTEGNELHLENHVSWLTIREKLALEMVIYRRCSPTVLALSVTQTFNRHKCILLLRDLAATANVPPHSTAFSLHLLDLTHSWSNTCDNVTGNDSTSTVDFLTLAAAVFIHLKLHSTAPPGQDPMPAAQQTTSHCFVQPSYCSKYSVKRLISRQKIGLVSSSSVPWEQWTIEKPKVVNARKLRGTHFIHLEDGEYKETNKRRRKLEVSMEAAMPRKMGTKKRPDISIQQKDIARNQRGSS